MAEQTLKEKTAKGLFWGGLSNGVQQVLNLVFGLMLARILDASDYGMVGMLAIFSAIASTIQESGFTAALTNQKEIRHEDYNAVFWFSTLTGVLFYLILFFCAPLIAQFYDKPELIGLSRIVFLSFLFGGFGIASNAYMFKMLMVKEKAKIDIISLICSGTIGVILALNGFAYYGLAIQTTTYIGISSLLKLYFAPWKPTFQINFSPLKSMFGFGSKLILTNIFTQISNNVFSVVLGKFYTPQQLGFYSQGQKWMGMGHQLIGGMINGVAQPVLVQVMDDKERQVLVFRKIVRFGAFISFPAMLGLAFVAKEFVWILLGEKWLDSVPFLQLFCFWGAIGYLSQLYVNVLMIYSRSDIYLLGMVLIGIFQILIIGVLYPFGIFNMVIGYIGIYFLSLFFWHHYVKKILPIRFIFICKDVLSYLIISVLLFVLLSYILSGMTNLYILLFAKIFLYTIFYILSLRLLGSKIFEDCLEFVKSKMLC